MSELQGRAGELGREMAKIATDEMSVLQGRVGERGQEMAKMATAPFNLSSAPRSQTATISIAPQTTSSFALKQDHTGSIPTTPRHPRLSSSTTIESTSPPIASNRTPSGTRLPYPQGGYTSPPTRSLRPTPLRAPLMRRWVHSRRRFRFRGCRILARVLSRRCIPLGRILLRLTDEQRLRLRIPVMVCCNCSSWYYADSQSDIFRERPPTSVQTGYTEVNKRQSNTWEMLQLL